MESIVLTEYGEMLLRYHGCQMDDAANLFGFVDMSVVENCIGIHKFCRGYVDIIPISGTHNVIHCRKCGRIMPPIPNQVDTFGKLRRWCELSVGHPGLPESAKRHLFIHEEESKKAEKIMHEAHRQAKILTE